MKPFASITLLLLIFSGSAFASIHRGTAIRSHVAHCGQP